MALLTLENHPGIASARIAEIYARVGRSRLRSTAARRSGCDASSSAEPTAATGTPTSRNSSTLDASRPPVATNLTCGSGPGCGGTNPEVRAARLWPARSGSPREPLREISPRTRRPRAPARRRRQRARSNTSLPPANAVAPMSAPARDRAARPRRSRHPTAPHGCSRRRHRQAALVPPRYGPGVPVTRRRRAPARRTITASLGHRRWVTGADPYRRTPGPRGHRPHERARGGPDAGVQRPGPPGRAESRTQRAGSTAPPRGV